jgi:hypothetical protein
MAHHIETTSTKTAYGRFSRRLKAFAIDWIIVYHHGNDVTSSGGARPVDAVNRPDSRPIEGKRL